MRLPFLRATLLAVLVVAVAPTCAVGQPGAAAPPRLTPDEQREITRLVSRFRAARREPAEQAAVVEEAIRAGEPAVREVFAQVARQLYPNLERYRGRFYRKASRLTQSRSRQIDFEEVARLRHAVLSLQQGGRLTKEAIVAQADPALRRLEEIFLVDRADVLAASEPLGAEREKLFALGSLWERCAAYIEGLMPDDATRPRQPPDFETYLKGEEQLAAGLAAPMAPRTRALLVANRRLAARLDPEEARAVLATNLTRNLLGLRPLAIDPGLCGAARDHSQDMRRLGFFAHESPVPGKTTAWDRAARFGAKANAENIYQGTRDGRAAVDAWFHSPGHHVNLLGDYARVGVGRSDGYFTQLFGK